MKKTILCLILALAILFSCACPAFAASNDSWVLHGSGAEYITHNGKKYLPIFDINTSDYSHGYEIDSDNFYTADLEFDNSTTESIYRYASVTVYRGNEDYFVEVYLNGYGVVLYVAEGYMGNFNGLQSGLFVRNFILKTKYSIKMEFNITEDYSLVTIPTSISKISSSYFEWVDLYSYDADKGLNVLSGAVLKSKFSGEAYLLYYREYDSSYFYADGSFARLDSGRLYKVHMLTDEALIEKIDRLIAARPDDDLDWLAGTEPGYVTKLVSAIFFFFIIPGGLIVFSAIALKKCKKKMYRAPFIVLMSASAVLLITALILYI